MDNFLLLKTYNVSRDHSSRYCMPDDDFFGVISEGCIGYWGTGKTMREAVTEAKKHINNLSNCWIEEVDE